MKKEKESLLDRNVDTPIFIIVILALVAFLLAMYSFIKWDREEARNKQTESVLNERR